MKIKQLALIAGLTILSGTFGIQAAEVDNHSNVKNKDQSQQVQPHPKDGK